MTGTADFDRMIDELYDASYGPLVAQMFAICGDRAEAEDAVQEAFVTAIRQQRDVAHMSNPEAWVRKVAVDQLRHRWRRALVAKKLQPVRSLDGLRETARARERRAALVSIGAAAIAMLAVAGTVFAAMGPATVPAPTPTPTSTSMPTQTPSSPVPTVPTVPTRLLTYAVGNTIHYGVHTVTAEAPVREVDVTDDGVAFRTADGRIWFTDGTTTDEIGELGTPIVPGPDLVGWAPRERYRPIAGSTNWINSANSGSMLVWFEFHKTVPPDVIAYNTSTRDLVLQTELSIPDGSWVGLHSVGLEAAYFYRNPERFADGALPQVRLDLATGAQTPITREEYLAEMALNPARSLLVSHTRGVVKDYEISDGARQPFSIDDRHFTPIGVQPLTIRDALTNRPLEMQAPAGYPDHDSAWLVQWLDDNTVVVSSEKAGKVDLLVCPVPTGVCELAMTVPGPIVLPELG